MMDGKDYWERLQEVRLYTQERRRERYQVMFLWKLSQRLIHGYNIQFTNDVGHLVQPKYVTWHAPATVRRARESSLAVKGVKLFNLLPKAIRNHDAKKVDSFKIMLDNFLSSVADQPSVPGRVRAAQTNSLLHQIPMLDQN